MTPHLHTQRKEVMPPEFRLVVDGPANPFDRVVQALFDSLGRMTLEKASALVNLSPRWFSSQFRRKTGMGYRECQVWTRLTIASVWLTNFPWLRIADVAYELGYSDPIKFGVAFKKQYGLSPRAFRNCSAEETGTVSRNISTVRQNEPFTVGQSIFFNGSRYNLSPPTYAKILRVRKTG